MIIELFLGATISANLGESPLSPYGGIRLGDVKGFYEHSHKLATGRGSIQGVDFSHNFNGVVLGLDYHKRTAGTYRKDSSGIILGVRGRKYEISGRYDWKSYNHVKSIRGEFRLTNFMRGRIEIFRYQRSLNIKGSNIGGIGQVEIFVGKKI